MRAFVVVFCLVGCGAGGQTAREDIGPRPPEKSDLEAVKCHEAGEKSQPPTGTRRYEVKLATAPGVAWVAIDGKRAYKAKDPHAACYRVDLAPGEHQVVLRAAETGGSIGLEVEMFEHDATGGHWYEVFGVTCGLPGVCDGDALRAWKDRVVADRKHMTDPCSGARPRGILWKAGQKPDGVHPTDVELSFTLHVGAESSGKPPRSPDCPEK
jgi:hypothetical protein